MLTLWLSLYLKRKHTTHSVNSSVEEIQSNAALRFFLEITLLLGKGNIPWSRPGSGVKFLKSDKILKITGLRKPGLKISSQIKPGLQNQRGGRPGPVPIPALRSSDSN